MSEKVPVAQMDMTGIARFGGGASQVPVLDGVIGHRWRRR